MSLLQQIQTWKTEKEDDLRSDRYADKITAGDVRPANC